MSWMTMPPSGRGRGRPPQGAGLAESTILDATLKLLEVNRSAFSMRALARSLQVDVMAIYYYFPTKQSLLDAAVFAAFSPLRDFDAQTTPDPELTRRLEDLAALYLNIIQRYPGLTLEIARGRVAAEGVIARFDNLFAQAVQPLHLPSEDVRQAGQILVDYLHGFMLGGAETGEGWRFAVYVLSQGLQQLSRQPSLLFPMTPGQ